jgi:hypothetical protein
MIMQQDLTTQNDNTPAVRSKYLDIADQWAREHDWRHEDAARWMLGLAGGLHLLDFERDGFKPEDVSRVVQAWHGEDWDVWSGGFTLALRDGRWASLYCFALLRDFSDPEDTSVKVEIVPEGYDEQVANPCDPELRVFEAGTDLPELQEYLQRLSIS